jgi:hypothetical protein
VILLVRAPHRDHAVDRGPDHGLIRRDPNGAFVPHSDLMRSRFFASLYAVLVDRSHPDRVSSRGSFKKTPAFVPDGRRRGSAEAQDASPASGASRPVG